MPTPKAVIVLVLALSACGGGTDGAVATVGPQSLSQDRLRGYLADAPAGASTFAVADGIVEGWLDLTLVAEAAAGHVAPGGAALQREVLAPFIRTEKLRRLQNAMTMARSPLTDPEIRRAFDGDSMRLYQQILVGVGDWRDGRIVRSARGRADSIDALARAEAPFHRLAAELSQGPTARTGGYLSVVTRDQVTAAFGDSLWQLGPGDVSPVLRVEQGFQILRRPPLDEVHDRFAADLLRAAAARADSALADSLVATHGMRVLPATAKRLRAVLTNPDSLAPDSAWIVAFDDGGLAPTDAWIWLSAAPDPIRHSLARASDTELERAARSLGRSELLYRLATARGVQVDSSYRTELRTEFVRAADPIFTIFSTADAPGRQALVDSIVAGVLSGRRGPQLPAGLAPALRRRIPHALDRRALMAVARSASGPSPGNVDPGGR